MVPLFANSRTLLRRLCVALLWAILADECIGRYCIDNDSTGHWNSRSLLTRSISTSLQPRQQTIALDSVDTNVSGNCDCHSFIPDDARSASTEYEIGIGHRVHSVQSSVCRVDDAWFFCRTAA